MSNVVIIGGHGKIALRLAGLLAKNSFNVTSVIRTAAQSGDITAQSAKPHVLSLEDAPVSVLTKLFTDTRAQLVYFAAGAGGKGGPERTKAVDYEGAVKVFNAVEAVPGNEKPRVILISAIDCRNPGKLDEYPTYYTEEDKERSKKAHQIIENYYKWKFAADKDLVGRTAFKWTILRPSTLTDEPGTGLVDIGKLHLSPSVSRADVAHTLYELAHRPDAHGLSLDLTNGKTPVKEALDAAIKRGDNSYTD